MWVFNTFSEGRKANTNRGWKRRWSQSPPKSQSVSEVAIPRNPHSILGLRSPVQILTPIPEVARTKHKAQDFPSQHPEQTTLAS